MSEPRFKHGDKAKFGVTFEPERVVAIASEALNYVGRPGYVYLARYDAPEQSPFLVHEDRLTPVERWERCPGKHRHIAPAPTANYNNLERLVE